MQTVAAKKTLQLRNGNWREKPFAIEKINEMEYENENEDALGPAPNFFQQTLHEVAKEIKSEMKWAIAIVNLQSDPRRFQTHFFFSSR